jgi:hypothetical protein
MTLAGVEPDARQGELPMSPRKKIPDGTRQDVFRFYGRECVVSGKATDSLHHLDGNNANPIFENLVPVQLDLHGPLRLPTDRPGSDISNDGELDPERLQRIAREHYRQGETTRAFGCARLAHAMRHYYRLPLHPNDELLFLAEALHYLRRCLIRNPEKGYGLLKYVLGKQVKPTLKARPPLSVMTVLILLEEMGAWLNEFGACETAEPILLAAQERVEGPKRLVVSPPSQSGMLRQLAFCRIYSGTDLNLAERALDQANDCDDSRQNKIGIVNARTTLSIARGDAVGALDTVLPSIRKVNRELAGGVGHPEDIDCRYENYLALLSGKLFARAVADQTHGNPAFDDSVREFEDREKE